MTIPRSIAAVLVFACATAAACATDTAPAPTPAPDMPPQPDIAPDLGGPSDDMPANDDMITVADQPVEMPCVPSQTACMPDQCAMIEVGCDLVLDCGACLCDAGQPIEPTCGRCNLGRVVCDSPRGSCSEPDIPGLPEDEADCAAALRFVDLQQEEADSPDGSRQAPFGDLNALLSTPADLGTARVVIVAGVSTQESALTLADGIHLVGGFAPGPR